MLQVEDPVNAWSYQVDWQATPLEAFQNPAEHLIGTWIVFSDTSKLSSLTIKRFEELGVHCIVINADKASSLHKADILKLLQETSQSNHLANPLSGILLLERASSDISAINLDAILKEQQTHLKIALYLIQSLIVLNHKQVPLVCFATTGVQPIARFPTTLTLSPLIGFYRSLRLEHSELLYRHIDLDPSSDDLENSKHLLAELKAADKEDQTAYRQGLRYAPRLLRTRDLRRKEKVLTIPSEKAYQLNTHAKGPLENLFLQPIDWPRALKPQEIAIEVKASGLNFRDVLNALGLYPGEAGALGGELAGTIVSKGAEVEAFQLGDAVFGFMAGGMASYAIGDARCMVSKPPQLSFEDAAAIPIVFSTAWHALEELAKLKSGEKVLIHAGAGGVGLAAIQIAQHIGAEIYTTAGSPEKQAYLKSLGVSHVYHSRNLEYADQILQDTNGKGVDVVLNSITGEGFIANTLRACQPKSRFVEIGKRDIWTAEQMKKAKPDLAYFILALDQMLVDHPEQAHALLENVVAQFAEEKLKPLPYTAFALTEAIQAFEYLKRAKNIGKVVLNAPKQLSIDPHSAYLITGGLGGLGIKCAEWLVLQGAKFVVLASRNAPTDRALDVVKQLKKREAAVEIISMDIADPSAVTALMQKFGQAWPQLKGIIHAAGVLDDGTLLDQAWPRFEKVFAPKIAGSWNLHHTSLNKPLDFFILFSSVASVLGSPGQSNYAAANAFLDGLANYRHQQGLPALSISWGPWAEVGMAAQLTQRHKASGFISFTPEEGWKALEFALKQHTEHLLLVKIDWRTWFQKQQRKFNWLSVLNPLLHKHVQDSTLQHKLQSAALSEKEIVLRQHLESLTRKILGFSSNQELSATQGFFDSGMDSLMSVEFKNQLQLDIGGAYALPPTLIFDYPTLNDLTRYLNTLLSTLDSDVKDSNDKKFAEKRLALQTANSQLKLSHQPQNEAIAIIGMGCRFPGGANDPETFWDLLAKGFDAIREVPKERWDIDAYYDPNPEASGKMYTRVGGFLNVPVDQFDAQFFGISPREAEFMDPQQRLILEVTWEALEHAGINPRKLEKSATGVFVGVCSHDYNDMLEKNSTSNAYVGTGNANSVLAGRLSFLLGLQGPSFALDTACSSSLVAISQACLSLHAGECSLALVGGVNLILAPAITVNFCKAGMLSVDGHCKTFDEHANGYVRGEGCGVIVLKRLGDAQRDGDRILATIKGAAVNQDGASAGLTVPNGIAQEALLRMALIKANLEAKDISYVEVHGTGTPLGDPIEAYALGEVMKVSRKKDQPLWLGSVKTNIGHLEGAAGIAGVIKVVLALQHNAIPLHRHFHKLNPMIQLDSIPAKIPLELTPWVHQDKPRRAGVSSFGFSGTNAHVILEEAPLPAKPSPNQESISLITLSAKNDERLLEYAKKLLEFIKKHPDLNLTEMAYTLQVGRAPMSDRLGLVVSSMEDLRDKLQKFIAGEEAIEGVYRGQLKKNKELVLRFETNVELHEVIDKWMEHRKFADLIEIWVKGLDINWSKLYGEHKPQRIDLPTYPFARKRHWFEETETPRINLATTSLSRLHPLLHENCSTLSQEKFRSAFTGEEFFLKDHVVHGQKVLPAVAYLEMVYAALRIALDDSEYTIELKNVVWVRPLIVKDSVQTVNVALFTEEDDSLAYEVYKGLGQEAEVYCQGKAVISRMSEINTLDLTELQEMAFVRKISAKECYAAFEKIGLHYGAGHQSIESLRVTENGVLAKLKLPTYLEETLNTFTLQPSLVDGAWQAAIGFLLTATTSPLKPLLPFALDSIKIFNKCTSSMWAWLRQVEGKKLDIDLCDEAGNISAKIAGLSLHALEDQPEATGMLMLHPVWKERAIGQASVSKRTEVKVFEFPLGSSFNEQALQLFMEMRPTIQKQPAEDCLIQVVIRDPIQFGLAGLLKTAHLENPKIHGQVILVSDQDGPLAEILEKGESIPNAELKYELGKWYAKEWEEIIQEPLASTLPWKDLGIYLITSGAGSLGLIFAKEIALKTKRATIILTGRSLPSAETQRTIDLLRKEGCTIDYMQTDIGNRSSVRELIHGIQQRYGTINGILHSAGVVHDSFLMKKTSDEFKEVLLPKVLGTVNLDEETKEIPLDFFVMFSSVAAVLGNVGQADYATANAFMDAYALARQKLVVLKKRQGRTLALNWPLWKEGGMQVDAATETLLKRTLNMMPLETQKGIEAFYQALGSEYAEVLVAQGIVKEMKQKLIKKPPAILKANGPQKEGEEIQREVERMLQEVASKILKLRIEDLDVDSSLSDFGFDSILLTEFANQINSKFDLELAPTVFFEYPTIERMAKFLVDQHTSKFTGRFSVQEEVPIEDSKKLENVTDTLPLPKIAEIPSHSFRRMPSKEPQDSRSIEAALPKFTAREPIAIVGMSGVFPMSHNIGEFWQNLVAGKDCISEVPLDRWDWRALWGDPTTEPNKTNVKWGGFLDNIAGFDPLFFGISPKEALFMDPQQRLLMQHVWMAIEDAGYSAESLAGKNIGMFIGTGSSGYDSLLEKAHQPIEGYSSTGTVPSVGPNRMSYFLDIHGPSEPIETACSSSLVAIHRAVTAMQVGDCEEALVGGVNTIVSPEMHISFNKAGMLAEDGRCKTFSKYANGYVRGEGVGILFLKKLKAAESAGDHIYGIIRGSAENHGGRATSLTAPNPKAQADLLIAAYKQAGVDPRAVSYIEAHGTGTELGDPVEVNGLKAAFAELYRLTGDSLVKSAHCGLGSVKSNIGHLELASGVAGVIKVLLQMKHKTLVKSLHAEEQNPYIDLNGTPFYIVRENKAWYPLKDIQGKLLPRMAGVSSFGFGGVNSHVVIEEYISKEDKTL